MNTWRLIIHGECKPSWNMAVDGALLRCSDAPVLRIYRWDSPAITIGYFQDIEKEVNLTLCANDNVPVIRRFTGGGAVFHHEELTYSLVHPLQGAFAKCSITDSYAAIAKPLIQALHRLGVNAQYRPINDIVVGCKKISGSAQTRKEGKLLQHGTILVATEIAKMFEYLNVDTKKMGQDSKPVIALKEILGDTSIDTIYQQLVESLVDSFRQNFGITFVDSDITQQENGVAVELQKHYFANDQWNCRRLSPC